ncbi:hypothetical protein SCUCBS95973_001611 [Sporothrix curviconia]|uniref:Uncharacterized protein n=1 Tax=Sporothrix curviconia TaxID=1260050 RepID=A0ABP0B095_9PEZI
MARYLVAFSLSITGAIAGAVSAITVNTSSTTPDSTSASVPSFITSAATLPSTTAVHINTCSYWNSTASRLEWNDPWCSIYAGTVQLTYWPTDNGTYPATVYNSALDYTFTSPSVYMIVNTLYGYNPCGRLGPDVSSVVFAFDLTDVSTLVPYMEETASTRRSTRQLYLSDLGDDCDGSFMASTLTTQTHPLKNTANRCNPSLVIPKAIKTFGYPYWLHCGNVGNKFGLFDPPYAVPTLDGGLLGVPTSTSASPASSAIPTTPTPTAAPTMSTPAADPTTSTPAADPTTSTPAAVPPTTSSTGSTKDASTEAPVAASSPSTAGVPTTATVPPDNQLLPQYTSPSPSSSPSPNTPTTSTSIYYSQPPADAYTRQFETSVVPTQYASLGPSGIEIVNDGSSSTSTYFVPAVGTPVDGSASSVPLATVAVYQGQTLTMGGAAVTVTSAQVVLPVTSSSSANDTAAAVVTAGASRLARGGMGTAGIVGVVGCCVLLLLM